MLPVINRKGDAMERLRSGCKINIFLRLLGRRPDGYHELFSLFLPLNAPFDEMIIRDGRKEGIHLSCDVPGIDAGNNTVTKAWRLYGEASGFAPALEVRLVKGVPHGAGLGGGSADAAAVLVGLNRLYGGALSVERLSELGAKVGADVPFCMMGGVKVCTGIGEALRETGSFPERAFLVVMPDFRCDTKAAYAGYDAAPLPKKGGLADFVNSRGEFPEKMYNVFQRLYADERIEKICGRLREWGAEGASLSGSGAAVFGVFASAEKAMNAARSFPEFFTAVCKPVQTGIIIVDSV